MVRSSIGYYQIQRTSNGTHIRMDRSEKVVFNAYDMANLLDKISIMARANSNLS